MNRIKIIGLAALFLTGIGSLPAQHRLLPKNINHPGYNTIYPAVSGDGKTLIFMTDYSQTGDYVMEVSHYRGGKWQNPQELSVLGSSIVNNWGGYCLNYDGSAIYFSSRRSEGMGQFDIWYTEKQGEEWSRPRNLGRPINSTASEGNPSLSADGQRIYFMRCQRMTTSRVEGCRLYYADKGPRGWKEPVPLPDYINRGNTTSPRIMPDNRTLFFASDRPGGKGGVDIWMTRREGDHWSEPVNVSVVNTPENDYFFSVDLRSVGYYTTQDKQGKNAIAEIRLPHEFRLQPVIVRQGTVQDESGNPLGVTVQVFNLEEQDYEVRMHTRARDGRFMMILPAGARYDVAYIDTRFNKFYQAELVDARNLVAPRREYPHIVLPDLLPGQAYPLRVLAFRPYTSEIDSVSLPEIGRLVRLLKARPGYSLEIGAYQQTYREDSVASSEDLTEVRYDTVIVYEPAIPVDTLANPAKDSVLAVLNDSLARTHEDTALTHAYLERMAAPDSVAVEKLVAVYHNDRTPAEAEALKAALEARGIDPERLQAVGYRDSPPPVPFPPGRQRMVVIRLLLAGER